jgi:ATP synthase protein I
MTPSPRNSTDDNNDESGLERAVRLREERRKRWEEEGERSLWQNLSMIGALGWLIVTPTLIGVLLGRWLDRLFDSGIFFSGALIFLGVTIGCYLAWQRVSKE